MIPGDLRPVDDTPLVAAKERPDGVDEVKFSHWRLRCGILSATQKTKRDESVTCRSVSRASRKAKQDFTVSQDIVSRSSCDHVAQAAGWWHRS
jgi:hypothetical protein